MKLNKKVESSGQISPVCSVRSGVVKMGALVYESQKYESTDKVAAKPAITPAIPEVMICRIESCRWINSCSTVQKSSSASSHRKITAEAARTSIASLKELMVFLYESGFGRRRPVARRVGISAKVFGSGREA